MQAHVTAVVGVCLTPCPAVFCCSIAMLLSCVVVCVQASAAVAELRQEAQRRESELEAARSSWQCRVCFSRDVEQAFVGCGHMYCGDCMPSLPKCPVCRKTSQKIRLFR